MVVWERAPAHSGRAKLGRSFVIRENTAKAKAPPKRGFYRTLVPESNGHACQAITAYDRPKQVSRHKRRGLHFTPLTDRRMPRQDTFASAACGKGLSLGTKSPPALLHRGPDRPPCQPRRNLIPGLNFRPIRQQVSRCIEHQGVPALENGQRR
jgi:hypothetical protein